MEAYQVAVFPITDDGKVVLVSTRDGDFWVFPKGHREKRLNDREVAEAEAFEEAGIKGKVGSTGLFFDVNSSKARKLLIFPMRVEKIMKDWPERKKRERVVLPAGKAEKLLQSDLRQVLSAMLKHTRH